MQAQDFRFSITPTNDTYHPVKVSGDDAWHVVQSSTSFEFNYDLPEVESLRTDTFSLPDQSYVTNKIQKSYEFFGYRVASLDFTEKELKNYLQTCSDRSVTVTAVFNECIDTIRTEYSSNNSITKGPDTIKDKNPQKIPLSQTVKMYVTPTFTTAMPETEVKVIWSQSDPIEFSYEIAGGDKWQQGDFYYTINEGTPQRATGSVLYVPMNSSSMVTNVVVTMKNFKCLAPDGTTEWTPMEAKTNRTVSYKVYPIPVANREATIEKESYIFNGRTITLSPDLFGGDDNSWTYTWITAAGNVTGSKTIELSTTNNRLNAASLSQRAETKIKLVAENNPVGIEASKKAELEYIIYTVAEPDIQPTKSVYMDFSGNEIQVEFTVNDSDPTYYQAQESAPYFYLLQNGQKIPLTRPSGSEIYLAMVTPTVSEGSETIDVIWNRQLHHADGYYNEDIHYYKYQKTIKLDICRKPTIDDIDSSASDKYALAKDGYTINLAASADALNLEGTWTFNWNDRIGGNTVEFPVEGAPVLSGNDTLDQRYKLKATYTLPNNKQSSVYKDVVVTFLAKPEASKSREMVSTCVGVTTSLGLSRFGGNPEGWSIKWYDKNHNPLPSFGEMGGEITVDSDIEQDSIIDKYYAELKNEWKGRTWYDSTLTYELTIYKRPSISIAQIPIGNVAGSVDLYSGCSDQIHVTPNGGYTTGWEYEWFVNNAPNGNDAKTQTVDEVILADSDDMRPVQYKVRVKNMYSELNQVWYDSTFTITYNFWSKGTLSAGSSHELNLYGGTSHNTANLEAIVNGGFKGSNSNTSGNIFYWSIKDGSDYVELSDREHSVCQVIVNNQTSETQDAVVTLVWQNLIDNEHRGANDSIEYTLHISPKVTQIPSGNSGWTAPDPNNPERLRDIDVKNLTVAPGVGGNKYGWHYLWSLDGVVFANDNEVNDKPIILNDDSNRKRATTKKVELNWYNESPDGTKWEEGTLTQFVKVYNTPAKPTGLQLKGNGTSQIYFAEMGNVGLSDEQLFSSEYEYVFQFGEGNSNAVKAEEQTQRWHQYNNLSDTPWVRTCWHYEDYDCCSDIVDANGNTRAYLGIQEMAEEKNISSVLVMHVNGTVVQIADSEDFSGMELAPGMYICKNLTTGKTQKILVKN